MQYFVRTFLFLAFSVFAMTQMPPSTTIAAETTNNTSAAQASPNGNAEPGNVSKLPIRSLLYPGATTTVLVRFMPWFGDESHKTFGYHSDDERQIARQIEDMKSRGIDGAIVDWYGPEAEFKNHVTEHFFREAERSGFKVAVSEDGGALKKCEQSGCDVTGKLISDLRYAADHFQNSPAYVRFDDRPVVTFFGVEKYGIDWGRVRRELPGNPMLLFRNSGGFEVTGSDGAFSWIAPETVKSGNPYGLSYLEHFNEVARKHSGKFIMGSAYKGFDDSEAGWGKGRKVEQDCGRTWLATFDVLNHFYNRNHPLPALLIVTWNDWEEGTEIESGIDNCVSISATAEDGRLRWETQGPKETLDHYEVFASPDGKQLFKIAELPLKEREFVLSNAKLPAGRYTFFVKAVAKASLMNHLSSGVQAETAASR
ncbi:MAG TPA: endo-1,3-alpha-glucanase family glycosylhydrolase [Candidatus Koribacter sp.]|jgi:hypothetical protein